MNGFARNTHAQVVVTIMLYYILLLNLPPLLKIHSMEALLLWKDSIHWEKIATVGNFAPLSVHHLTILISLLSLVKTFTMPVYAYISNSYAGMPISLEPSPPSSPKAFITSENYFTLEGSTPYNLGYFLGSF